MKFHHEISDFMMNFDLMMCYHEKIEDFFMSKTSLKELNLYFNIMNVKLFLLNQEMPGLAVIFLVVD